MKDKFDNAIVCYIYALLYSNVDMRVFVMILETALMCMALNMYLKQRINPCLGNCCRTSCNEQS